MHLNASVQGIGLRLYLQLNRDEVKKKRLKSLRNVPPKGKQNCHKLPVSLALIIFIINNNSYCSYSIYRIWMNQYDKTHEMCMLHTSQMIKPIRFHFVYHILHHACDSNLHVNSSKLFLHECIFRLN